MKEIDVGLKARVIGQEHAVEKVAKAVKRSSCLLYTSDAADECVNV
ncbi:hypothetical protein H8I11_18710 [Bacillus pumilus]|nr:hypothetical protein [Bacillus pumilus]